MSALYLKVSKMNIQKERKDCRRGDIVSKSKKIHNPYNKFKGWLLEHGLTYKDIGDVIGVNTTTVSLKINGQSDFYLSEVILLIKEYDLTFDIFFKSS